MKLYKKLIKNMNILFTKEQNLFFKELKESYAEEIFLWYIFNVIIPVVIIFIPSIFYYFLPEDRQTFQNLVLNGSFSLLGINILFGMCAFLINSIKIKDKKIEDQITEIRKRLIIYMSFLFLLGTVVYIMQIMSAIDTNERLFTVTLVCVLSLLLSITIGKRIYLLKDEIVGTSYKDDINDGIQNLTDSVDDLE